MGSLSIGTEAGRHLGILVFNLMEQSTTAPEDSPTGLLDQKLVGLEAILKATSMTHIAHRAGLPLATHIFALMVLYNKTERETLEWLFYPQLKSSVNKMIEMRKSQVKVVNGKGTLKLFPYCRLVHQRYHQELGAKGSEEVCSLLPYGLPLDLKSPPTPGTAGAKGAMWARMLNPSLKTTIENAANQIYRDGSTLCVDTF